MVAFPKAACLCLAMLLCIACTLEASQLHHLEGTLHSRKLSKRAHFTEVAHANGKRTTLEPVSPDPQGSSGKPGNSLGNALSDTSAKIATKLEWDPYQQYGLDDDSVQQAQTVTEAQVMGDQGSTAIVQSKSPSAGGSSGNAESTFSYIPRDEFTWDGENSWEWDYPRTLYFEPVAGLGNRLRAVASAIVLAKDYGVGLKIIWRMEEGCGDTCGNPGFNSTWPDLFAEPKLRLAENFPGSNYSVMEEGNYLRAANRDEHTPPLQPGQCLIHYPHSFAETKEVMENGWQEVNGESILCIKSDLWLTEAGEKEGKFFFRLLKPSTEVQAMIDSFKYQTEWEENHMVGVHVRRGDLTIYGKNDVHSKVKGLIPISTYIDMMRKQKELAAGIKRVRFFLATDDAEAEAEIKAAFKPGHVITYEKHERSRLALQGIREALVDVMLLADCPVLIGTYYSSYSETAKMMGWPFYIQVGHALKKLSVETVFEKDDPEEDEEDRKRMRRLLQLH